MSTDTRQAPDLDRLLKLRLVVARFGEMDGARWWNTGGLLGRKGALLMSRGFPKTHHFAQARVVFSVARARCREVFDPPACTTLWTIPAEVEDRFDARWSDWLAAREPWAPFFDELQQLPAATGLLDGLERLGLLDQRQRATVTKLSRSAEGRAVPIGTYDVDDEALTLLAAAFARGEEGKLAVPYARLP